MSLKDKPIIKEERLVLRLENYKAMVSLKEEEWEEEKLENWSLMVISA